MFLSNTVIQRFLRIEQFSFQKDRQVPAAFPMGTMETMETIRKMGRTQIKFKKD
jgi:hypothetical protein